ncbi:MAG: Ig-like domain-containing protein [Hyalangium sp.]|uniref:Ig-like domain-containing protein n=1 Tax=Hyalangium sp. TaxID=2028555 RepID=UPI00389AD0DD
MSNEPPVLTGPTVEKSEVSAGAPVPLALDAADLEADSLTYTWTQIPASPAGTFSSASEARPTWTAPQVTQDTDFQLAITVTNSRGETAQGAVTMRVHPPSNQAPSLSEGPSVSSASVTDSEPVKLSVSATDADHDPLFFSWTQEPALPAGSFNLPATPTPVWTPPLVSSPQRFTLKVVISDGRGGTVQGQVDVEVAPTPPANRPPVFTAGPSAQSGTVRSQQFVGVSASASDEDGDTLTYAWTQEPASPAGTFNNASSSNTLWTAPQVTEDTRFVLHVTVSDGKGGSVSGSVQIIVLAPVYGPKTSVTAQGCTFTVDAVPQAGKLPPFYDYVVTRQASSSCPYGAATTTVSSSYTSDVAITGNTLGIAVAYTQKGTPSGSAAVSVGIVQLAPDTLSTVKRTGLSCGPTLGNVYFSNLFIPDGTTLQVDGTKGCVIYGGGETGSGSNYHASYADFFTATNPPSIVAY